MRGLWKAALLLAPALVSADWVRSELHDEDFTSAIIEVPVPGVSGSPDVSTVLNFRVDVVAAENICGPHNLSINGQELTQEDIGKGSLIVDGKTVDGSWMFSCIHGFSGPYAQRLDFNVLFVDGKIIEDVSFWVEFQQSEGPQILSASWVAGDVTPGIEASDYEDGAAYEDFMDLENFDIEREMAELEWMKDLVKDLKYQILLKEESMALYLSEVDIEECDSLKCVIGTLYSKARVTAHSVVSTVYSKLVGHVESDGGGTSGKKPPPGKKPPHRKLPFPFPPFHGNHSHHNHTCPGKGNHTLPFPHPHPHPRPPFCRCPRPRPPPHCPPHHGPPPPGKHPGPPSPHDGKPPGGPPGHRPGPPPSKHHGHQPPPPGKPPGKPHGLPPPIDGPPSPPLGGDEGPPFDSSLGRRWHQIKTTLKYFAVVTLLFFLVAVVHRRCCCSAARRQAKKACREERLRRRAFRRAAHKHAWRAWFARYICRSSASDDLDEEEKRAMLAGRPTEGQEDAVASEICEFRNAASVVSDMIEAEEGRHTRVSMVSRSSLPEYMSELGGECLPTYEDGDGTELSSVVADGFRYTPGSGEYTPGHSSAGSVNDVLGDVKE